jgi:predicted CoA-binding protein
MKPTLVIGASENPERYSYKAINMLLDHNHSVYGYGIKSGQVRGVQFMTEFTPVKVDTVTMYVGAKNQDMDLRNYILSLKPNRVIFNPGTENPAWEAELNDYGITTEEACTLVLLQTGQY